jgi:hypothetical protein
MWIVFFWVIPPCSLVRGNQCFGGMYRSHFHFYPKGGDDTCLRNDGNYLEDQQRHT